jgi:hypothetical protein
MQGNRELNNRSLVINVTVPRDQGNCIIILLLLIEVSLVAVPKLSLHLIQDSTTTHRQLLQSMFQVGLLPPSIIMARPLQCHHQYPILKRIIIPCLAQVTPTLIPCQAHATPTLIPCQAHAIPILVLYLANFIPGCQRMVSSTTTTITIHTAIIKLHL